MLESLEGKRGEIRSRPPLPAIKGLFGQPTIVNNVISLASVPIIPREGRRVLPRLRRGPFARHAADPARPATSSTAAWSRRRSASRCARLLYDYGGGTASGRPIRTVQVGGPLGAYLPESQFDTPLDYEAFTADRRAARPWRHRRLRRHGRHGPDGPLRHGVLRHRVVRQVHALPHRFDPRRRGASTASLAGRNREANLALLEELCDTMLDGSLCGLGGMTPFPVQSA